MARVSHRSAPWVVFGVFLLSFSTWSLLTPLMAVPDEPAHTLKAASIWQGDLRGDVKEVDSGNPDIPIPMIMDEVDVPQTYADLNEVPGCYAFQPEQSADCSPGISTDRRSTQAMTSAGRYPPTFYAVVGWPSSVFSADIGVYLMRLTSALVSAALVASAFVALRLLVRPAAAFAALSVASVPMLHFLAGSVNPNGVEIAAALAFWCAAFAAVTFVRRGTALPPSLCTIYVASGVALVLSRALSPVFAAFIVAWSLLMVGWPDVLRVVRHRTWWLLNVPVGVTALLSGVWVIVSDGLGGMFGGKIPVGQNTIVFLTGRVDDYLLQSVAIFGWMDNGPLSLVTFSWLFAVTALVTMGLLTARRRWNLVVLMSLCLAGAMLPVIMQASTAAENGVAWQGRYGLPVLVGIPVLAVIVAREWFEDQATAADRLFLGLSVLVSFGLVVAQVDTLQRYAVGNSGPIVFIGQARWSPPIGTAASLMAAVLAGAAFVVTVLVLIRGDRADRQPGTGGEARLQDEPWTPTNNHLLEPTVGHV